MDELLINQFRPENWNKYSISDKYRIVDECIAGVCEVLGLPKIGLSFSDTEWEGAGPDGYYCPYSNDIYINSKFFEKDELSGYKALSTIFHECRHYEQDLNQIFDLSIGIAERDLYYLDIAEYDAHIYEFFADGQISNFLNDERFDKICKENLGNFFANFCYTLSKFEVIGPVDTEIYKNLFIQKFVDNVDKIYSDNFLKAYELFTNTKEFGKLYETYLLRYRNTKEEEYKELLNQKTKYKIGGPCVTQAFSLKNYDIILKQKKGSLNLSIVDTMDEKMPEFQLFIKGNKAACFLEYGGEVSPTVDLGLMQEIGRAVIKQYEIYNNCTVDNIEIGDTFAANPIRKIDRTITDLIDFSIIKDKTKEYDNRSEALQNIFYTEVLNEYNRKEENTPVQELDDDLKCIFYELATQKTKEFYR